MNPFIEGPTSNGNSIARQRPRSEITRTHSFGSNSAPDGDSFELMMTIGSGPNPYQPTVVPIARPRRTRGLFGSESGSTENQADQPRPVVESNTEEGEWAFCEEQFKDIAGFTIRYSGMPYSPNFKVRPHARTNALPVPRGSIIRGNSLKSHRAFYCDFKSVKWQTVKFHRSGNELFHFAYKPTLFGGRKSSCVSLFSPEHHERVGYVRISEGLGKNAEIVDCINHLRFTTRPHFNELCTSIEIVDGEGNVAAIMNGAWGRLVGNETCYQISFSEEIVQKSGFTKAVFLTALAILAIDSREKFVFEDVVILGLGFLALLILLVLVLKTWGGTRRI